MCATEPVSHIFRPQRSGVSCGMKRSIKIPFTWQRVFQRLLQCSWTPSASFDGLNMLPPPATVTSSLSLSLSEGLLLTGEPWHLSMQCHHLLCWGFTSTTCFFCHRSAAAKQLLRQHIPMQSHEIFNISMLYLGQAAFLTKAKCQGSETGTGAFLCAPRVHTNALSSIPRHGSGQQRAAGQRSQC